MKKINIRHDNNTGTLNNAALEELYRKILMNRESAKVILFPGIGQGSDCLTAAEDLAVFMSESGHNTLIVDADLRRDKLSEIMNPEISGESEVYGLGDYLNGLKSVDDILYMTDRKGLYAVFSGKNSGASSELLEGERFTELISLGIRYFDYILIDCAPADRFRDAEVICTAADAVIPVVRWHHAKGKTVRRTADIFGRAGIPVSGCILADVPTDGSFWGRVFGRLYRE